VIQILWWMIVGHLIADYPLQTDFIAKGKCPSCSPQFVPWYYVLAAHSATHGAAVAMATGSTFLGLCETIVHFCIDVAKCEGVANIHVDQALHVVCKLAWLGILYWGIV